MDDILDVTSDYRGLKGKITYNDIYESKRTLLLGHLLQKLKTKDRNKVLMILSKSRNEKSEKDVLWIIEKMTKVGSIDYAKKVAANLAKQAFEMFNESLTFLQDNKARKELKMGISFILNRDY